MLQYNYQFQGTNFKPLNLNAMAPPLNGGQLHPLMKVRAKYRQIFFEMGFEEMPTNNFVESGFWNFDTLFQPQQHPARDAHDTFFCKEPASCNGDLIPKDYLERVRLLEYVAGNF
jgi:phenylalanyl-tRNA synthetase alpha chain